MIVAVMQPYFFPYIGYFQLMHAVDTFVFYDDVQYINRGWVNRNRIRFNATPAWLTLPVRNASSRLFINQRQYLIDPSVLDNIVNRLRSAYSREPTFQTNLDFVIDLLLRFGSGVADVNIGLLEATASRLGIEGRYVRSSALGIPGELRGQSRIIAICQKLRATHYTNPFGGVDLYDPAYFRESGIHLDFLRTTTPPTMLDDGPAHLSILDMLFRDGAESFDERLKEFERVLK